MTPRGPRASRVVLVVCAMLSLAFACTPIEGSPLSVAPLNAGCPAINPCDKYDVKGTKTPAQCSKDGRCDYGRPDFAFTMVVDLPTTSFFAPGRTFVLTSDDFRPPPGSARGACVAPTCLLLPAFVPAIGKYRVSAVASQKVGLPLTGGSSLPARVTFVPLLKDSPTNTELVSLGIPLDGIVTSSRLIGARAEVSYLNALSLGDFLRISSPEPPYDEFFPPVFTRLKLDDTYVPYGISDEFTVGQDETVLDDESGETRTATVTRNEGLDGFRVWLELNGRRISSMRRLAGKKMVVRLDTVGQSQLPSKSLKENVDVIVAPPDDWVGVPRLQSRLINGQGLELLALPTLPAPVSVSGVVANGGDVTDGGGSSGPLTGTLTGIPARLLFESTGLRRADDALQPLLRYSTAVSTDETGHFTTVLPPGAYDVTIEPAEGTGFSKMKDRSFDTVGSLTRTYRLTPRTVAVGRAVLADGRPLAEAEVLAIPSDRPPAATAVKPRPARTRTDRDGRFRIEVDQGLYDLVVDPQPGTGFPRVVSPKSFVPGTAALDDIVIPPPARLSFVLRDSTEVAGAVTRAMVRIFADLPGRGPPAVEIGRAMTDDTGKVEILLAQQPR